MKAETISVSLFRERLFKLFPIVRSGKLTVIVTYYGVPAFTVTQCDEEYDCKHQFKVSEVRKSTAIFQDELEDYEFVLITRQRGKLQKILCTKVCFDGD